MANTITRKCTYICIIFVRFGTKGFIDEGIEVIHTDLEYCTIQMTRMTNKFLVCQSIYRISEYTRSLTKDETPTRL